MTITYVLLSGGIDSSTALARALSMTPTSHVRAMSCDYGQRHKREIDHARMLCKHYGVEHAQFPIVMPRTMLTDPDVPVPDISYSEIKGVSPTYVPFRNGLMLSTLASYIAGRHLDPLQEDKPEHGRNIQIWWGAHAEDAENWAYPDCTQEFIGAMACAIYIGTYHKVRLVAPFASMMKHEIISEGHDLGVPYEMTFSCYRGGEVHCGTCATCISRRDAFKRAGVEDPTQYLDPLA